MSRNGPTSNPFVLPPVACVCGHLKRVHYGRHNEGTCLGAHRNEKGKEADATVCACLAYRPA